MFCNYIKICLFLHFFIVYCSEPDQCDGKARKNSCGIDKKFENTRHFNIVLLGATGNLANKYLWNALFEFYIEQKSLSEKYSFRIYAASRNSPEEGRKFLSNLFINTLKCNDEICKKFKKSFAEAVQYVRLRTSKDFKFLESLLDENTQTMFGLDKQGPNTYEVGRLFYFSIPPSAYASTATNVHKFLRPKLGRPWVRLVLEKPFGFDVASSKKLTNELSEYFKEEEIFRVDHYLAKSVIQQIIPMRYANKEVYDSIWNHNYIDRIDIVMKELEDVRDRTSFYDETGIIRDVFQNHLTEMMALIAGELPENSGNIHDVIFNKIQLLKQVEPLNCMNTLTGQYSTYNMELVGQNNLSSSHISRTPTYATVVAHINNNRWKGVPFVFLSGKKLDEKTSYIHIHFRQNRFCLRKGSDECEGRQFIHFRINGGDLPFIVSNEFIAVSDSLPKLKFFGGWEKQEILTPEEYNNDNKESGHIKTSKSKTIKYFGTDVSHLNIYVPKKQSKVYPAIISAAFDGLRNQFVSNDFLLQSWHIWEGIAKYTQEKKPRQYLGRGKDSERLDFVIASDGSISFFYDDKNNINNSTFDWSYDEISTFSHGNYIINTGNHELVSQKLALEIKKDINYALGNGSLFNIALSGGNTPVNLFQRLCRIGISWSHVHIWQVDERCTSDKNLQNFQNIEKNLINKCNVPFSNIHPISPTGACPIGLAATYTSLISNTVKNNSFDIILLGLGSDGHIASIFPSTENESLTYDELPLNINNLFENPIISNIIDENDSKIFKKIEDIHTDININLATDNLKNSIKLRDSSIKKQLVGYSSYNNQRRISLSLTAINRCKKCIIYVLGEEKSDIVAKVMAGNGIENLPISKVKPFNSHLEWFLDMTAFSKTKDII